MERSKPQIKTCKVLKSKPCEEGHLLVIQQKSKRICTRGETPIENSPLHQVETDGLVVELRIVKDYIDEINRILAGVVEIGKDMKKARVTSKYTTDIENHITELKSHVIKIAEVSVKNFSRVYENRRLLKQTLLENTELKV